MYLNTAIKPVIPPLPCRVQVQAAYQVGTWNEQSMNFQERKVLAMIYKQENDIGEVEIIALLRKGSEKALEILFRKYHKGLLHYALGFLKDYQASEDVAAESFITVWKKRNDFDSLLAIRSFLYITVKNACLNLSKQAKCHTRHNKEMAYLLKDEEEFFSNQITRAELLEKLWQDVETLPPIRRRIFKMFFVEGLSSFEIAKILRISIDTVRVQKARALHKLRAFAKQIFKVIL